MFKKKIIISITIFVSFLVFTSTIKNKTRIIEKNIVNLNAEILIKSKNVNEAQLDFFYLTSPAEIEKKLSVIGFDNYNPIKYSSIFFNIDDFTKIQNITSNLKTFNAEKIKKK
tara:strand:+ start:660 stop:998 length:339 start_codon:yes stop_codon:yes gene_type:complete